MNTSTWISVTSSHDHDLPILGYSMIGAMGWEQLLPSGMGRFLSGVSKFM